MGSTLLHQQPLARSFLIFGLGRRACPGARMTEMTLFLNIATLLAVFNHEMCGWRGRAENWVGEWDYFVSHTFRGIYRCRLSIPKSFFTCRHLILGFYLGLKTTSHWLNRIIMTPEYNQLLSMTFHISVCLLVHILFFPLTNWFFVRWQVPYHSVWTLPYNLGTHHRLPRAWCSRIDTSFQGIFHPWGKITAWCDTEIHFVNDQTYPLNPSVH